MINAISSRKADAILAAIKRQGLCIEREDLTETACQVEEENDLPYWTHVSFCAWGSEAVEALPRLLARHNIRIEQASMPDVTSEEAYARIVTEYGTRNAYFYTDILKRKPVLCYALPLRKDELLTPFQIKRAANAANKELEFGHEPIKLTYTDKQDRGTAMERAHYLRASSRDIGTFQDFLNRLPSWVQHLPNVSLTQKDYDDFISGEYTEGCICNSFTQGFFIWLPLRHEQL